MVWKVYVPELLCEVRQWDLCQCCFHQWHTKLHAGLSLRSKLANFFSLFVCFLVYLFEWAIVGWNTGRDNSDVLSKAFDCVKCRWTSFDWLQTFFRWNYRGLVEEGRNALWLLLICSQQIVWRSSVSEAMVCILILACPFGRYPLTTELYQPQDSSEDASFYST